MDISIQKTRGRSLVERLENKIEKRVSEQLAIPHNRINLLPILVALVLLFLTYG